MGGGGGGQGETHSDEEALLGKHLEEMWVFLVEGALGVGLLGHQAAELARGEVGTPARQRDGGGEQAVREGATRLGAGRGVGRKGEGGVGRTKTGGGRGVSKWTVGDHRKIDKQRSGSSTRNRACEGAKSNAIEY